MTDPTTLVNLLAADPSGTGLLDVLTQPFMRRALLAGIPIAALAGLVGYFLVLRSQVFAADALSHVAFTGALGALAFGIDPLIGLFAATVAVGVGLGLLGERGRPDDVVIGTVFAWILGLGVLALALYTTNRSAGSSESGTGVLFGSVFGLTTETARTVALIAVGLCVVVLAFARPLLFASLDEGVARSRGVPVRVLGVGFLAVLGATAAAATPAVGALLILGLLAAPAGAAHRLTTRPYVAMALATGIAVTSMVAGLLISYLVSRVPPSFAILAVASGVYALTFLAPRARSLVLRARNPRRDDPQTARYRASGAPSGSI